MKLLLTEYSLAKEDKKVAIVKMTTLILDQVYRDA